MHAGRCSSCTLRQKLERANGFNIHHVSVTMRILVLKTHLRIPNFVLFAEFQYQLCTDESISRSDIKLV